jgi:hypothetical protein
MPFKVKSMNAIRRLKHGSKFIELCAGTEGAVE